MAAIREKTQNGKVVSYQFVACIGRDKFGKQIRKYTTWKPEAGMTPKKARKAAERAADRWEQDILKAYEDEQEAKAKGKTAYVPPEKRHDDFVSFINDIWFPLHIKGGDCKPCSIAFYQHMVNIIVKYFDGYILQEITPIDIQKYLIYLRTEYRSSQGKPLSAKTARHHYGTLTNIFNYAEQQDMIVKNPMRKVKAPKKESHPVDALSQEQAEHFFPV